MPVQSYKVGPGSFTLGAGPLAVEAQLSSCTVDCSESVTAGEVVPVLSGEELRDDDEVTRAWSVSGNIFQDLAAAGFVAYTWEHAGESVPFTFVPNTVAGRGVTGTVRVVPVSVGGEAKKRARSDFTFQCPTEEDDPVLGDA